MKNKTYNINSEEETIAIAKEIAKNLKPGSVVLLRGDLGSGKSFLAREIIRSLLKEDVNVISPTFNLLQVYEVNNKTSIYHYDLYRLKDYHEIFELGIEEALTNNICLIEWPDIIKNILPDNTISIKIDITGINSRRIFVT